MYAMKKTASERGLNLLENLIADGLHVKDISFSGGGKDKMVTKMSLAFEKGLIKIPRSLKHFSDVNNLYIHQSM